MFVYPSAYEGFGLPPLEALACETPVVVSKSASLPEITGSHGVFVDTKNLQSLVEALQHWEASPEHFENMAQKGSFHARNYCWEKMAEETVASYEACIEKN